MIYVKNQTAFDKATDAQALVERIPEYAERFEALHEIRKMIDPIGEFYSRRETPMRPVASIPEAVINLALAIDPAFLLDKPRFMRWLDSHPEYKRRTR